MDFYSDLALEAKNLSEKGYDEEEEDKAGFHVTRIDVKTKEGAKALGRDAGRYTTVDLPDYSLPADLFEKAVGVISEEITALARLKKRDSVLIVGLGNAEITPDSLGPFTLRRAVVTRHLKKTLPRFLSEGEFRDVSGLVPGVLGQTGIESLEITRSVVESVKPDAVILIDSLAARTLSRLGRAVQISDRGLVPGGGVGNSRAEISEKTLGVRCLSIGVPTVMTAESLISRGRKKKSALTDAEASMIITPKDVCQMINECSRLIGCSLSAALHYGMTLSEISEWLRA